MNKFIFLLSTFLLLPIFAKKEDFNAETLGLNQQQYAQVVANCMGGERALKEIAALLPDRPQPTKTDCQDIKNQYAQYKKEHSKAIGTKLSAWNPKNRAAVTAFHAKLHAPEADILIHVRKCAQCETLGSFAEKDDFLRYLFPKIITAQNRDTVSILESKITSEKQQQQELRKQEFLLNKQLQKDFRDLEAAKAALTNSCESQSSLVDTIVNFLKDADSTILELLQPHANTYCDDYTSI